MGNTLPQLNTNRSGTSKSSNGSSKYPILRKSRSLREYSRSTSFMNSSTRKNISIPRPQSLAPTDAEIIDMRALRCAVVPRLETSSDAEISTTQGNNEGENQLNKQLDYIRSCVRKDKGLLGQLLSFFRSSSSLSFDDQ